MKASILVFMGAIPLLVCSHSRFRTGMPWFFSSSVRRGASNMWVSQNFRRKLMTASTWYCLIMFLMWLNLS